MPAYFKFLTIMAFHIFLEELVDVAIIEVGIGGEYDCTNIIRYRSFNYYLNILFITQFRLVILV